MKRRRGALESPRGLTTLAGVDPSLRELLDVAIEAAFVAGRRTLADFNTGVAVETKPDQTPVTRADREAEALIRGCIRRRFPAHAIVGEESGAEPGDPDFRWTIDPIDGTKSFIAGVPLYATLLAVEVRGRAAVGVIYLPALDELIAAADGLGCRWNGRAARVSTVATLADAALVCSCATSSIERSDAYLNLAGRCRINRTWGDAYGYALVATGRAEIMLDPVIKPWDVLPMLPILREAGGRFSTWAGESSAGPDAVATNAALYEQVLPILRHERRCH